MDRVVHHDPILAVRDPEGREFRVSKKAWDLFYAERGWEVVT